MNGSPVTTPTQPPLNLGVAIVAQNSQRTIGLTLESVAGLAQKVVVVDGGSKDGTVDICRAHGAIVIHKPWQGHVKQKQFAIDQCRDCEWTLLLDSDESLERELYKSIRETLQTDDRRRSGWMINRKIWFLGGWLKYTYQPEWRLRLFRSNAGHIAGTDPHDRVEVKGRVGRLQGDLRHDTWANMTDMVMRHVRYAQIATEQNIRGGTSLHILFSPPAAFAKQLLIKRGIFDGWRGVLVAGMMAQATLLKHAFLAARRHTNSAESIR